MAKPKKKQGKYDTTLKINGTFEEVITALVRDIKTKKLKKKKI